MFGLGWTEVAVIGLVALLVFGPKKIPELGTALGKTLRGFKEELNKPDEDENEQNPQNDEL
ncbi:twin-arginine translocase TatA/TatE family subunit [Calothrix sp. NIES-3974]|uniref:twin-arginine translocase TatA/TatE family subunit n=1 Tax=Calothrix sp. NIES-3974 TaxID=2005462 RepID=UPI000B61E2F0|nr:twin-arginine translocase TatA/TatE family subunit [Calothrix sp. NIES-3974]BAZ07415.1 twin arginine-targeting protein translocase [Calothrix sp. NIES-3974]